MKNGQANQQDALVSFKRFERAVKHIVHVPKAKVLDLVNKNNNGAKNSTKKNGHR